MLQKGVESGHIKLQAGNLTDFKWVENSKLPLFVDITENKGVSGGKSAAKNAWCSQLCGGTKDKEEGGNNFKQVILFTFIGIAYQVDN